MKWKIITTGKPSFPWTRQGLTMYAERLQRYAEVEQVALRQGADLAAYEKAAGDSFRILLDERGAAWSTRQLCDQVLQWEQEGLRLASVWIGGADGLPEGAAGTADLTLSFGSFTLMHELALLVWMEQLYRVYALKHQHPYHRA